MHKLRPSSDHTQVKLDPPPIFKVPSHITNPCELTTAKVQPLRAELGASSHDLWVIYIIWFCLGLLDQQVKLGIAPTDHYLMPKGLIKTIWLASYGPPWLEPIYSPPSCARWLEYLLKQDTQVTTRKLNKFLTNKATIHF